MALPIPERLRIAFVADTWDPRPGGVVSAQRMVDALRERHEVTVVSSGEPGTAGPGHVVLPAFAIWPFQRLMRENGFLFAWPRRRVLEDVFRRVDLVHVQFPFWLGIRATAVARRMGKPIVAAHHVQPENFLYNLRLPRGAPSRWMYRLFLRTVFNRADAVVCPSPLSLEELRRHGLAVPAEVISNGIAPGFGPASEERAERHHGRFLVLSVGRLSREKRLDVVVEGVRRSRHASRIQLVLTGRGPDGDRIRSLAATLPVPAEMGFVSEGDLKRLLHTADLMVHASEVELEGMAVLEAVGCGTPALIADAPHSASRQFAASPDFLFRPGDPDDLARRLDRLLDRPELLRAGRERSLARAPDYSFARSVERLEALYRRAVELRARAAAARGPSSTAPLAAR